MCTRKSGLIGFGIACIHLRSLDCAWSWKKIFFEVWNFIRTTYRTSSNIRTGTGYPYQKIRTTDRTNEIPYQIIRTSYRTENIRTALSVPRTVPSISVQVYPYHVQYQQYPYRVIRTEYRTSNDRTTLSVPRTVPKISVPHYPYNVPYRKNPYHFIRTTYRTKKIRTVKDPYHVPDRTITYRRYGQPCSSTRLTSNEGS